MTHERVIVIVIDACGVGELPDADQYGDRGASTIPHVASAVGGLSMPHCQRLGLGNIVPIDGVPPTDTPHAHWGRMAELSAGKDSTAGHWELAGVVTASPLPIFPNGFPPELLAAFTERVGVGVIGNEAASGTEIIARLGEEHLRTKKLILYTSADSVFQVAAHEDVYSLERQYEICHIARELCVGDWGVGRVIARPFVGSPGSFERTAGRKDFSRTPDSDTVLDTLVGTGRRVLSVGKINDLFAGRGISMAIKTRDNSEVMTAVQLAVRDDRDNHLIFANCVDFDMLWGHRNDYRAFANGLVEFDRYLGNLLPVLRNDDLLIITADHGCDPTLTHSTDHTREYVPLLAYSPNMEGGKDLGTRESFRDVAATIAHIFALGTNFGGKALELSS